MIRSVFISLSFVVTFVFLISFKIQNSKVKPKTICLPCDTLKKHLLNNQYGGFNKVFYSHEKNETIRKEMLELKRFFVEKIYKTIDSDLTRFQSYDSFFKIIPQPTKCKEGELNNLGKNTILKHLNLYRFLVGLTDSCIIDQTYQEDCQKTAMMMDANNNISHSPDKSWKCYKKENYEIANSSNLSYGHSFHHAISGQIQDFGKSNYSVGHRRWIMNPKNKVFSFGATDNAFVLKVFGFNNSVFKKDNFEICYPSKDFFPKELLPERWSFSKDNIDFNSFEVKVWENNKPIVVKKERVVNGYALPTLVFIPQTNAQKGNRYKIKISNKLKNQNFEYEFECL